mmetsp:Transcript_66184/g.104734  ORF Transcript_66184/g.104734 Transcript_66184/m.104734 type:complete len:82 (+) Transcript_66184:97-342(+)
MSDTPICGAQAHACNRHARKRFIRNDITRRRQLTSSALHNGAREEILHVHRAQELIEPASDAIFSLARLFLRRVNQEVIRL